MSAVASETNRILQRDVRGEMIPRIDRDPWITVLDELG